MAAKKSVVYTPLSNTGAVNQEKTAGSVGKIDIPNYADVGVAYTGYSKKFISENRFILTLQKPFKAIMNNIFAAGTTSWTASINEDITADQNLYITCVDMSWFLQTNHFLFLHNGTAAYEFLFASEVILNGQGGNKTIYFNPPFKTHKKDFVFTFPACAFGDRMTLNIWGWIE